MNLQGRTVDVPQGTFESAEISAVITRCGCGDPNSHPDAACLQPRGYELAGENGVIGRIETEQIAAYSFEREPTLTELLGDLARALWQRLRFEVKGVRPNAN